MIIAIAMQKGGVGKTTTTLALGSELARSGARVLLIDLDPQASLTKGIGVDPTTVTESIYEVLLNPTVDPSFAILQTAHGVDLIPATDALNGASETFAARFMRELMLRTALAMVRDRYDYILLDTPPNLGILTVNALIAADTLIIPLQAHVLAFDQMPAMDAAIATMRQMNPSLTLSGIVITMLARTNVNAAIEDAARQRYGDLVFDITIPHSVKVIEAPNAGTPITTYAPESSGATAYRALTQEVRQKWASHSH